MMQSPLMIEHGNHGGTGTVPVLEQNHKEWMIQHDARCKQFLHIVIHDVNSVPV